jgi:hypothetical protein
MRVRAQPRPGGGCGCAAGGRRRPGHRRADAGEVECDRRGARGVLALAVGSFSRPCLLTLRCMENHE